MIPVCASMVTWVVNRKGRCGHARAAIRESMVRSISSSGLHAAIAPRADCLLPIARLNPQVKGYPTVKVIHKNEEYKVYRGQRDVASMLEFITGAAAELTTESS